MSGDYAEAKDQPGVLGSAAKELREFARVRAARGDHEMLVEMTNRLSDDLDTLKAENPDLHELERLRSGDKFWRDKVAFLEARLRSANMEPYGDDVPDA